MSEKPQRNIKAQGSSPRREPQIILEKLKVGDHVIRSPRSLCTCYLQFNLSMFIFFESEFFVSLDIVKEQMISLINLRATRSGLMRLGSQPVFRTTKQKKRETFDIFTFVRKLVKKTYKGYPPKWDTQKFDKKG